MKYVINLLWGIVILFSGTSIQAQSQITYKSGFDTETVIELAQACYYKKYHRYAENVPELIMYLNKATINRSKVSRALTDKELESGMTQKKAIELGLIKLDSVDVLLTDELLGKGETTNVLRAVLFALR